MQHRAHIVHRASVLVTVLAATVPSARGDKLVFDPSISIGVGHTNNITFQGEGDSRKSDLVGVLQFEIPLQRETRRSRLRFQYRPTILRYQDFDSLDYTDHRADLDWRSELGRRSDFRLQTTYINTQQQGSPEQPTDPDIQLTERVNRENYRLSMSFTHQLSQRWDGNVLFRGQGYRFNPVGDGVAADFQDRSDTGIRLGAARQLSSAVSVGGRYEYRYFDLEESSAFIEGVPDSGSPGGDESSNQLAVTYTQEIARRLDLRAALGGFANSGIAAGTDRTGVLAELFLTRTFQTFSARLDLFHRPSAGGSVNGTSIASTVGLTFTSDQSSRRKWIWQVAPRASRREPSDGGPSINTFGLRGNVERRFGNLFGLSLRTDWFGQNTDDSVFRADLGFLWYPWGGTELGGRGG